MKLSQSRTWGNANGSSCRRRAGDRRRAAPIRPAVSPSKHQADAVGFGQVEAPLHQARQRHPASVGLGLEAGKAGQRSLAEQAVADVQLRDRVAGGHQVIGDVAAVGGQVGGSAGGHEELAETSLAIVEVLAQRPQAEAQGRRRELRPCGNRPDRSGSSRSGAGSPIRRQASPALRPAEDLEGDLPADPRGPVATVVVGRAAAPPSRWPAACSAGSTCSTSLTALGRLATTSLPRMLSSCLWHADQGTDAGRAEIADAGQVDADLVVARADQVVQHGLEVVGPVTVEPAR